jgi:hypothetical protein
MTINCIAFAVNLLLIIIGVWLADQIAGSESRLTAEPAMSLAGANGNAGATESAAGKTGSSDRGAEVLSGRGR